MRLLSFWVNVEEAREFGDDLLRLVHLIQPVYDGGGVDIWISCFGAASTGLKRALVMYGRKKQKRKRRQLPRSLRSGMMLMKLVLRRNGSFRMVCAA
jgi:hypothetical protein